MEALEKKLLKLRKVFLEEWFGFNTAGLFAIISLLYIAFLFVKRIYIIDSIAAFEVLNERGEVWVFDIFYGVQYLSVPLFLVWKFAWTTTILWIGCFMFGIRLHFNQLWKLVTLLEVWFFMPEILKVLWFVMGGQDPNYHDYVAFYPIALINMVDYELVAAKWHYPLKALNLFEVVYWLWLIVGVFLLSGKKLKVSILIVLTSYVFFFLIWLLFYVGIH